MLRGCLPRFLETPLRAIFRPKELLEYKASIQLQETLPSLTTGQKIRCRAQVSNQSRTTWPSRGRYAVKLSYHWLYKDGEPFVFDGLQTRLSRNLKGGEEIELQCLIQTPNSAGRFILELDLIQQRVAWFKEKGSTTTRIPCTVVGKRTEDFGGYENVWRQADLAKNWWSIVGPASEEEFNKLGKMKLQILTDLGLTPNSHVLDVGCGTGCLTEAAHGFLSENGVYYGTDVGKEAIEFCRRKFSRSNFVFLQNGMTTLPIDERKFDFIVFFSVFTHTFPDETLLLLHEAKRLLADGGIILSDVFTSSIQEKFAGHRAMIEVNEAHLLEMISQSGLLVTTMSDLPWGEGGVRRKMFKFTLCS